MIKKQYHVYSKNRDAFQHGTSFNESCWSGRHPKLWKTFAPLIDRIERDLCGLRRWYGAEELKFDKVDDLEIIEYEIVLKEIKRINVKDLIIERQRERMIREKLGWQVVAMYIKMRDAGLDDFRYIMAFSDHNSFTAAKERLKELDIVHGRQYRFCQYVMIFNDMDNAIITKLSFADDTSEVYDIETLRKLEIGGQE